MTGDGTERRLDELESRIERQQERLADQRATITAQRERIERLEAERTASMGDSPAEDDSRNGTRGSASGFSRRGILQGLGVVGLLGFGAGTASAAEPRGEVGTGDRPVDTLYLDALSGPITDGADLTTLVGDGLAIDDGTLATTTTGPSVAEHGNVVAENPSKLSFEDNVDIIERDEEIEINVSDSNTNTQTDVSDDGTTVVESTGDVDFGSNLAVSDDGDGSATVDADVHQAINWDDSDGLTVTENSGTVSLGIVGTCTDTTNTFSGVSVDHSNTSVSGGDVVLSGMDSSTASLPEFTSQTTSSNEFGVKITVDDSVSELEAKISSQTSGASTVYLYENGSQLATKGFPGPGGTVTFTHEFTAGHDYYVTVDNGGSDYSMGRGVSISSALPTGSAYVTIQAGYTKHSDYESDSIVRNVRSLTARGNVLSGQATVDFGVHPDPISRWETATCRADHDGETVAVYVEISSDGGSSWSDWRSTPISSGTDLSAIPADRHIRFRAELSRNDGSNTPRLLQLGRQWRP